MNLTGRDGILQVHPTRRCNLRCQHCYSDSGPDAREQLTLRTLREVVDDAVGLGYNVLSVSGGEPLLYRPLPQVLGHARARGMRTLVTTNGTVTSRRRLAPIAAHLDLLALSLDGPPAEHDEMRARSGAFDALARRMDEVRASGIRFGFLFTLTQHNVHQLDWAVRFALAQGAALLQVHPLEATGRGTGMRGAVPDEVECIAAALEVVRLRRVAGNRLRIHLDLAVRGTLPAVPAAAPTAIPLARLVSPLVIEPDGRCVPLEYGFPEPFALGNVTEHRLAALATGWRGSGLPRLHRLVAEVHARLSAADAPVVADWYAEASRAATASDRAPAERQHPGDAAVVFLDVPDVRETEPAQHGQ